jgi:antitoxin (DNA-binding transcriptional repressor) of toxin-antitoxin stability system
MKTATVRDLRNNFGKLETWLAEGEEIQIEKRGEPIAVLSPPKRTFVKPDYQARRKRLWGDRVFSEEEVKAMREAEYGPYEQ